MLFMGKAEENKRQKKDALMHGAFDLFTTKGIANTSIAEIAEKAGVGKGTFYSYFKDKGDIHDRLVVRISSEVFTKAKTALDQTSLDTLEDQVLFIADNIIDQLKNDRLTTRFISKNLSWGVFQTFMSTTADTASVDFNRIFQDAFNRSPVKYKDPFLLIYMIIELVNGTCYSAILYQKPKPVDKLKPDLYEAIRAIMRVNEVHSA